MEIDRRILLINDARRAKLGKLTKLFTTMNGLYDNISDVYDEMRNAYDDLIANENELVMLEQENYDEVQQAKLERVIIRAANNGCVTFDTIMNAVRNHAPEHLLSVAGRHAVAMTVTNLVSRDELISVPSSGTMYGVPERGSD